MPSQIWAPWRMKYITGETKDPRCFMCAAAEDPAQFRERLVLVTQPHALVMMNKFPYTTSHLLVAPRRHVGDLTDLSEEEYDAMMRLVRESAVRLRKAVSCEAMNIGFNLGRAAGAGHAEHIHGHLVPRWTGDNNFMPVLGEVRVMSEYLDEAWQRLNEAFADLPGVRCTPGPSGGEHAP